MKNRERLLAIANYTVHPINNIWACGTDIGFNCLEKDLKNIRMKVENMRKEYILNGGDSWRISIVSFPAWSIDIITKQPIPPHWSVFYTNKSKTYFNSGAN